MNMNDQPWLNEPNYKKWIDPVTGYWCMVRRVDWSGALVGYVRVPSGHKYYRKPYWNYRHRKGAVPNINVHGGLTFCGRPVRVGGGLLRGHWFGFDCAHAWDLLPYADFPPSVAREAIYRDWNYVTEQVLSLAKQLKRLDR